ncbi:hypothetical protein OF83DRAFT_758145 [Amylostereum chailletii]|nr:hypothetical protein OF83DRAFT_758145 [Amylostereum chailletii]
MYSRALLLNAARARAAPLAARQLHATPVAAKTMADKAADVADTVNKKVGKGLASALETGEKATEKTKETLGAHASASPFVCEGVRGWRGLTRFFGVCRRGGQAGGADGGEGEDEGCAGTCFPPFSRAQGGSRSRWLTRFGPSRRASMSRTRPQRCVSRPSLACLVVQPFVRPPRPATKHPRPRTKPKRRRTSLSEPFDV